MSVDERFNSSMMSSPVPKIPVRPHVAPDGKIVISIEQQIKDKQAELLKIQQQLELQLNGVANQLYLIDQLLTPGDPPSDGDSPQAPPSDPPGTI